jgi:hypothetical protein
MIMSTNAMPPFTGLVLTTLGLAAGSDPTVSGPGDAAQIFPSGVARPTGPFDNTANSLGARFVGGGSSSS